MTTTKWNIDAAHSGLGFSVRHMMSKVRGRFRAFTGELQLDDGDLTKSSATVAIDATSIDTGVGDRDAHLRGSDFFDVEKFPQLRFRTLRIEKLHEAQYRVVGELTIKDVTREVVLDAEYNGRAKDPWGHERVGLTAKGSIDRKEFGLQWNQLLEAGGFLVGDRIDLDLDLEAVNTSGARIAA